MAPLSDAENVNVAELEVVAAAGPLLIVVSGGVWLTTGEFESLLPPQAVSIALNISETRSVCRMRVVSEPPVRVREISKDTRNNPGLRPCAAERVTVTGGCRGSVV